MKCFTILEKIKRIWPNQLKAAAAAILMLMGMITAALGAWIFIHWSKEIDGHFIGGERYLPEFYIDFSSFSGSVINCILAGGGILILSQVTAHYKHPITAMMYVGLSVYFSFYIRETQLKCTSWIDLALNLEKEICKTSLRP